MHTSCSKKLKRSSNFPRIFLISSDGFLPAGVRTFLAVGQERPRLPDYYTATRMLAERRAQQSPRHLQESSNRRRRSRSCDELLDGPSTGYRNQSRNNGRGELVDGNLMPWFGAYFYFCWRDSPLIFFGLSVKCRFLNYRNKKLKNIWQNCRICCLTKSG